MRKSCIEPARLAPADLDPVRALIGDSALDYALVIGAFHFINRIADLLHVDPEAVPETLRRFEPVRRFGVWAGSKLMRRMDLANRAYPRSYEEARARLAPVVRRTTGRELDEALSAFRPRPKLLEIMQLALEERVERSSLDAATFATIDRTVEAALPATLEDAEGFHPRPLDPVEAFAFVGTRYAYRTTDAMIAALHGAGFDDTGILDLAIAVADANQWARVHRLVGVAPELFSAARRPADTAASSAAASA